MFGFGKNAPKSVPAERLASLEADVSALRRSLSDLDSRVERWIRRERSQTHPVGAPVAEPELANGHAPPVTARDKVSLRILQRRMRRGSIPHSASNVQDPEARS